MEDNTMTAVELMVRSSIQIYQADKGTLVPKGFGTGCIVRYLGQNLLLSVSHVTNNDDLTTYLETNVTIENGRTLLQPIGGLVFYDLFKVTAGLDLSSFEKLSEMEGERLDITFAKINKQIELKQPIINFEHTKIDAGQKLFLDLNYATVPDKNETYGFYGNVRPEYKGKHLVMTPALKLNLEFHRTNKYFHMFLAPEIIKDGDDYRGCSGAPILDSEGKIVALACKVVENTRIIYGFSILECMKLIKLTIDINEL